MKKIILSMAVIVGLSSSIFAQDRKRVCCEADQNTCLADSTKRERPRMKNRGSKDMKQKDFKCEFSDLNLTDAQKQQLQTLRKEHREKIAELRKQHLEEKKAILTPEQLAQFEKNKPNRRVENRPRVESSVRFDEATEAKLKELSQELKEKRDAIKKTRIAPEMMEKKLKDLNEEYAKKRVDIVTEAYSKNKEQK